jgi:hypothetical protein
MIKFLKRQATKIFHSCGGMNWRIPKKRGGGKLMTMVIWEAWTVEEVEDSLAN